MNRYEDVPVASASGELLLVTPAALLRQLPSMRLDITLTSADDSSVVIGTSALEHTAQPSS